MRVPPRWVRRLILAPLVVLLAIVVVAGSPLWLLIALIFTSLVPGFLRLPRIILLLIVYVVWDAALLVTMFVLWCASGFGWKIRNHRSITHHYMVGQKALNILFTIFRVVLRLKVTTKGDDGEDIEQSLQAFNEKFALGTPLVVASRHGGPGDSIVIMQVLLTQLSREPRIVLKDTIQWDPALDVLLSRVPARFITPTGFARKPAGGGSVVEQEIGSLADGLDENDALVIFPEGGQVTDKRRLSRTKRLFEQGHLTLAQRAAQFRHVMPPQPRGLFAALESAPNADVVFLGHTGLDKFTTIKDIWRQLPMDKELTMRAWRVPRNEIPTVRDEQATWLFNWFEEIDRWIARNNTTDATGAKTTDASETMEAEATDVTDSSEASDSNQPSATDEAMGQPETGNEKGA